MNGNDWVRRILAVVLSLGLVFGIYLAGARAVAQWNFLRDPPEGLQRAISWDSRNPMYYTALARVEERSLQGADPQELIRLYERAVQLSPARARYWADLGGVYEMAGRQQDAQRAYERARELFPNSPDINWQLGNFYLRQGNVDDALPAFQRVLLGNPSLWQTTFDLVWRAGADDNLIFERMMPPEASVYLRCLNYLGEKGRLDAAGQAWKRLLALGQAFEPQAAFPYLDALIREKRVEEMTAVWTALAEHHPQRMARGTGSDLMNNGAFENEILNGGLDWRVQPVEGVIVSVDTSTFFDGTRSLKLRFDSTSNMDYHNVYQLVPVRPNSFYRFMSYLRVQDITTDSGPRFQVRDAYDPSRLSLLTESMTGTAIWEPQMLEFRAGPETHLLQIRLVRLPSSKIVNQISGLAWADRVSLSEIK
ncbi:MAG: tetratricopeptide repeat protein [Candidatus Acidiferrales bacterium]